MDTQRRGRGERERGRTDGARERQSDIGGQKETQIKMEREADTEERLRQNCRERKRKADTPGEMHKEETGGGNPRKRQIRKTVQMRGHRSLRPARLCSGRARACSASSGRGPRPGGAHGVSERDGQRVIVLHQGGVLVVEDELLQGPVQVVGLREAEARGRAVDDAVLGIAVHPAGGPTGSEGRPPLQAFPTPPHGSSQVTPSGTPASPPPGCWLPIWPRPCHLLL